MIEDSYKFDEISGQGFLARIVGFEAERSTMFIRLPNGMVQTWSTPGQELLIRVRQTNFGDADTLDSIGGLTEVVREARRLVLLPMEEPERFNKLGGSPIKGVLFTEPPGVGKTMSARALAREAGAAFYNIRGPELSSILLSAYRR